MADDIERSNVVPISEARARRSSSKAELLQLAQQKADEAAEAVGPRRRTLLNEAISLSEDCVDAYLLLSEGTSNGQQSIEILRKAEAAVNRLLGADWTRKYEGIGWMAPETRQPMRVLQALAEELHWEDELEDALELYQKLMKLNPSDSQGVRYQLARCLYEAGADAELEDLLSKYQDDPTPSIKYTRALFLFRQYDGSHPLADEALIGAFNHNKYVPLYVSEVRPLPEQRPESITIGGTTEAIDYCFDNDYLWWDTPGASAWMANTLEKHLRKAHRDQDEIEKVINALLNG